MQSSAPQPGVVGSLLLSATGPSIQAVCCWPGAESHRLLFRWFIASVSEAGLDLLMGEKSQGPKRKEDIAVLTRYKHDAVLDTGESTLEPVLLLVASP